MTYHGDDVLERPVHSAPADRYMPWPIAPSALEALVDLGMSDDLIARYFRVRRDAVVRLRREVHIEAA